MNIKGFTLIELVVVIVILGVLSVTAVPKFIDLSADARKAEMQAHQGSLSSAIQMAFAKNLISGDTNSHADIKIGDNFYAIYNGYPDFIERGDGSEAGKGLAINGLIEFDSNTVMFDGNSSPAIFEHTKATTPHKCRIEYFRAQNSTTPAILTAKLDDCS